MKVICFDLNKTLIKENSWRDLNLALGVKPEEDDILMDWGERGIISDKEGQQLLLKIYQSSNKHTLENIKKILFKYTYVDGAKEIVKLSIEKGYTPLLVSGSIDLVVEQVAKELGIKHWKANNYFKFNSQGLLEEIETIGNDKITKLNQLIELSMILGFKIEETICVGDGDNDSELFKASMHGVTFENSKIIDQAWKIVKSISDIKEIL